MCNACICLIGCAVIRKYEVCIKGQFFIDILKHHGVHTNVLDLSIQCLSVVL